MRVLPFGIPASAGGSDDDTSGGIIFRTVGQSHAAPPEGGTPNREKLGVGAVRSVSKVELLAASYCPVPDGWSERPLHPEVAAVAAGSFKHRHPPQIRGTGYVVQSLEAALWAFHHTDNFRDGCLRAVNLGDDADTTGAIYGQLAGACYGEPGLPEPWLEKLALPDAIATLAEQLVERGGG